MEKSKLYIARCLQLAENGRGTTYPNPMVGAVVVHNDVIIGEGWHRKAGTPHAEVHAINSVKNKALLSESTIYVSLEPCSHFGKTPPCADLIVSSGIPRAVIATTDPHSRVAGKGIAKLKAAGVEVELGVLRSEADALNVRFNKAHLHKRPYVILKYAQSSDGFLDRERQAEGIKEAQPNWISNRWSKQRVHQWRAEEQAIMVGSNTVLIDNPDLGTRLWSGSSPLRVVLDRQARITDKYKVKNGRIPTLFFTSQSMTEKENLEYFELNGQEEPIPQILDELGRRGIQSLFVEGGLGLLNAFIGGGYWDEARVLTGQRKFGGGLKAPNLEVAASTRETIAGDVLEIFKKLK